MILEKANSEIEAINSIKAFMKKERRFQLTIAILFTDEWCLTLQKFPNGLCFQVVDKDILKAYNKLIDNMNERIKIEQES